MAQPQGLNVPAIITTGIVTTLLTGIIIEGVRALYAYEEPREAARKWDSIKDSSVRELERQQTRRIKFETNVPIDEAMKQVAATGGKLPSTKPAG